AQLVGPAPDRGSPSGVAVKDLLPDLVAASPWTRSAIRERILRSMDPRTLAQIAFQESGELASEEVRPILNRLANDDNPEIRSEATDHLAAMNGFAWVRSLHDDDRKHR